MIAAWTDAASLGRCLASLRGQAEAADIEVVVVRNFDQGAPTSVAALPGIVDVALPATTTVPALRAAGFRVAHGGIIAFLEDHCTAAPGWVDALRRAHAKRLKGSGRAGERESGTACGLGAVGGPVEQADGATALDWAVYFYDYGRFMPPCEAGPVTQLSGLNMSFTRAALEEAVGAIRDGVFEADLQAALRASDQTLYLEPAAVVVHGKRHRPGTAVRQAYHLARSYAARRVGKGLAWRRLAFGLGAIALPPVLLARIAIGVFRRRRHRAALLRALPWLTILVTVWSAGEVLGYLVGSGSSAAAWR